MQDIENQPDDRQVYPFPGSYSYPSPYPAPPPYPSPYPYYPYPPYAYPPYPYPPYPYYPLFPFGIFNLLRPPFHHHGLGPYGQPGHR